MKNVGVIVLSFVLAVTFGILTLKNKSQEISKPAAFDKTHTVTYVYDGDTVKLDNKERIRLIGIDTPESHDNPKLSRDVEKRHISREKQLKMGLRAAHYVRDFLKGRQVRVEFDVQQRDRYGRLLAYLYLEDGTFVNEKIIRDGYAYPLTVPPNVRHAQEFKQWFDEAREQKRGLWQ